MSTSHPLILKNSAPWRMFPLLALIPLILTGAILAALYLNGTPLAELTTPALGMGGLSLAIFAMLALVALITTLGERMRINAVRRDPWAVFPQFASEDSWRDFVEAEWQRERRQGGFPWSSLVVIAVVFIVIAVVVTTQFEAPPELFVGIGAMLLIILGVLLVATQAGRWAARGRYQRRQRSPAPVAYLGKWGIYDEDAGFENLRGLQAVDYVAPGVNGNYEAVSAAYAQHVFDPDSYHPLLPMHPVEAARWAKLRFTVRYWRALHPYSWRSYKSYAVVRVPPGCEGEAQALVRRYETERL